MDSYKLCGRIDSNNAAIFEKELRDSFPDGFPDTLILDASELEYISSAGLRILLRIQKENVHVKITQVGSAVYDILDMTGLTQIIEVERALRQISIEGCPEIGRGAHGVVYRIAPDTIVKVYRPDEPLEDIRQEKELAKWALVRGIPTAIPQDIVQVGNQYGTVFELLDARAAEDYILESPENLEDYVRRSVELLKQIHEITVEPDKLPNMKKNTLNWIDKLRRLPEAGNGWELPEAMCDRLEQIVLDLPDPLTLLHADFHLKNIMICEDELMLIDMDTLCTGDPIFDLGTIYNSYRQFPSIDAGAAAFLGIDVETSFRLCDRTMELYLDDMDDSQRAEVVQKARLIGCIRIIDYMLRNQQHHACKPVVDACLKDMKEMLS